MSHRHPPAALGPGWRVPPQTAEVKIWLRRRRKGETFASEVNGDRSAEVDPVEVRVTPERVHTVRWQPCIRELIVSDPDDAIGMEKKSVRHNVIRLHEIEVGESLCSNEELRVDPASGQVTREHVGMRRHAV